MSEVAVDLFRGPGGWSEGLRALGMSDIGVENDQCANDTANLAGHKGELADVLLEDPQDFADVEGVIASPPCQTFSSAGNGAGRKALNEVLAGIGEVVAGRAIPTFTDVRTALVLQPLRWALELEPEWLAWEQVPTVQPVWDACAQVLREDGYHVWTGRVGAEQYGVPQTRTRSILLASRSRAVDRPRPTHSRFHTRSPQRLDPGVLKWVSMAEALGWGMTARPSMTVTSGGAATGGAEPFGNAARQGMDRELSEGRWEMASAGPTARYTSGQVPRSMEQPSATITGKGTAYWTPEDAEQSWREGRPDAMGDIRSSKGCVRDLDQPSPTLTSSMDNGNFAFVQESNYSAGGRPGDTAAERGLAERTLDLPSSTITSKGFRWKNVRRVTVEEAAILQSFRRDYPWTGGKGKQYEQVGNAIPPLLATHVLAEVLGLAL